MSSKLTPKQHYSILVVFWNELFNGQKPRKKLQNLYKNTMHVLYANYSDVSTVPKDSRNREQKRLAARSSKALITTAKLIQFSCLLRHLPSK